jgi:DNA-binding GntR family transcriptional regulator
MTTVTDSEGVRGMPRPAKVSLSQQLYQAIRSDIITAVLRPGAVVIEADLARAYEVSKTPVREALQMLVVEGLMSVLPNRGYLIRSMGFADVRDVMDLRLMLEPPLAAAAALNSSEEIVEALRVQLAKQFDEGASLVDRTSAAREFHMLCVRASKNQRAMGLVGGLYDETTRIHHLMPGAVQHLYSATEQAAHQSILDAVANNDGEAAAAAMGEHIKESNDALLQAFYTR